MNDVAKWFVIAGGSLILIGILWQLFGRFLPLGRLPGDIIIERENMRVYFPIVTMIVISIVLSLLFSLGRWIR